jgi:phosphate transport system permease protein
VEAGGHAAPSGAPRAAALGAPSRTGETVIKGLLFAAAALSVLTTLGIVASLVGETVIFFGEVGVLEYLFGTEWSPLFADPEFGVLPLVFGTLIVTAIALLVAIPLGLGSAIYLSEYARASVRKVLKPVLEVLAGIPTIVFGYFALTFFTPVLLQDLLGLGVEGFNALGAGIIMGFLVLPTVASVAEDSMSAVPQSLREGAYGLGGSRLQVSLRVVLPAALSGVVAAIVLGASRAIGETVIVLVAGGLVPSLSLDPGVSHETMTAFIAATAGGEVPAGSIGYLTIFAVGTTLFVFTLILNVISIRFVRRYRQVYE